MAKHVWSKARFTGAVTCARCGLLPMDDEDIESACTPPSRTMSKAMERVFSPSVSITEIDGAWYPTTAADARVMAELGIPTKLETAAIDRLLARVSACGYCLETISEEVSK